MPAFYPQSFSGKKVVLLHSSIELGFVLFFNRGRINGFVEDVSIAVVKTYFYYAISLRNLLGKTL